MPSSEHVQSKDISQVEEEKDILAKELIERNNEIMSLKQHVGELQMRIDSHICAVILPENLKTQLKDSLRVLLNSNF